MESFLPWNRKINSKSIFRSGSDHIETLKVCFRADQALNRRLDVKEDLWPNRSGIWHSRMHMELATKSGTRCSFVPETDKERNNSSFCSLSNSQHHCQEFWEQQHKGKALDQDNTMLRCPLFLWKIWILMKTEIQLSRSRTFQTSRSTLDSAYRSGPRSLYIYIDLDIYIDLYRV